MNKNSALAANVEKILVEKMGLQNADQKQRDAVIGELVEALLRRIFYETTAKLSTDDQKIFLEKVEDENVKEEDVNRFLTDAIPDYDQFVAKVVDGFFADFADFEKEMLSGNDNKK